MRILCWNCRRIGDPATVHELRELIRECAPSVVCLVETQLSKQRVEGLTATLGFEGGFAVASSGRSGGLGVFWRHGLNFRIKNYSRYHIDAWVSEPGKDDWRLTCFYGEANRSLRQNTWDTMARLRGESTLPWLCIGDFNEILRRDEQIGPNERDTAQMAGFREAVDLCGLDDLGYIGLDWTFEKRIHGGQHCRVRLDRALATANWSSMFPFASVRHLVAAKSDHSPLYSSTRWMQQIGELVWTVHSGMR